MNRSAAYAGTSLAVLAPCIWQRRIQAGDLSSHIYNAWLAELIGQGKASGLVLVHQTQNVLFDLLLSGLLRVAGAAGAQRMAVGMAVLIFFWGAFALVQRMSRRTPWMWTPCLAMLAYGWVYHMGLFNFYLSLGLSFWALAVSGWRAPAVLFLLAYVAHPMPVAWATGVMAYREAARRMAPRYRAGLLAAALGALAAMALLFKTLLRGQWMPDQGLGFSGADQLWVFGPRYIPLAGAVLVLWALWFAGVLRERGVRRTLLDWRLHVWMLTAACIVLIPTVVVLPGTEQAESLLIGRISLAGAVLYCGLAASAPMRRPLAGAMALVAGAFFVFIYQDEAALNRVEDRMEQAVAQLPTGQRVVSALMDTNLREFALLHVIDRVCVGRCYSYANYEPSVAQFRVRAAGENGIVAADFRDSWAMQAGGYVVKARDLPLYRVDLCGQDERSLCAAPVAEGVRLERRWLHVTPELWRE